jgi:hypothetical protein
MFRRTLPLLFAVLAVALASSRSAIAEEKSHDGIIVSVTADKLTMTMSDGSKEHSHDLTKEVTITLDDKPAKIDDLKKGFHVTVTLDGKKVTKLAAHSKVKKT